MHIHICKKRIISVTVMLMIAGSLLFSGIADSISVYADQDDNKMTVRVGYNDTGYYIKGFGHCFLHPVVLLIFYSQILSMPHDVRYISIH